METTTAARAPDELVDLAWRGDLADPSVGRGNVRDRLVRLRRGPVPSAWQRLRTESGRHGTRLEAAIDLVAVRPVPRPEVMLVAGAVSRLAADEHRIELAADTTTFDLAFAYAHELGHLFDRTALDDAARAAFSAAVGTGHPWSGGRYQDNVEEAWASAFAVVACPGPWRCTLWAPSNWPADRTSHVLAACRDLIAAAT